MGTTTAVLMLPGGNPLLGRQLADKSSYHLFSPAPREAMREMTTDRPDTTESPYTVDAGHFQVEMSFADFVRDDADGARTDQFTIAPTNFKVGLLNNVDLQFVLDPFVRLESDDREVSGFGNTQLRMKVCLWGNDSCDTALAIMPFVQFPTASHDEIGGSDHIQGGVIVPFAVSLPSDWSIGLMAEIDVIRNGADDGYGFEFVHTVTLGHPIAGELSGYIEYVGVAPHETGGAYSAIVGGGLTYALSVDVQLDVGVNIGISDRADDFNVFTGVSWRR